MLKIENVEFYENGDFITKKYTLSNNVQIDMVPDVISLFENEQTHMKICHCSTYDLNGAPLYRQYFNKSELMMLKDLPSPYISFSIDFYDLEDKYVHSVLMDINSDIVTYCINKRNLY